MIYLGYDNEDKAAIIAAYCRRHSIQKTVVISPKQFPLPVDGGDLVAYDQVIMYVVYYRLLQEIDRYTLVVINESLRTQNRYDLAYNCIRNYLNQTDHQLIFQQLPQIDAIEDFMILFDFDTRSRWKREKFDLNLVMDNAVVDVCPLDLQFNRIDVPTAAATKAKYAQERERLFAAIGAKDPHTLPRTLHLLGGRDKLNWIDTNSRPTLFGGGMSRRYVARNRRLGRDNIITYTGAQPGEPYTLIDLPHRFIDFSDFIRQTGQTRFDFLAADLAVDTWYFNRYQEWKERINETYASLRER